MRISTVFLDRDGVINRRPGEGYVTQWRDFEFLAGVKAAISLLTFAGIRIFVVTNQRGIAHGLMSEEQLRHIHRNMVVELESGGGSIDGVYYCPHHPNQCECKKPLPGMFLKARNNFPDVCFDDSVVIGDSLRDIQAGYAVGCKGILVGPPNERPSIVEELDALGIPLVADEDSLIVAVCRHVLPHAFALKRLAC